VLLVGSWFFLTDRIGADFPCRGGGLELGWATRAHILPQSDARARGSVLCFVLCVRRFDHLELWLQLARPLRSVAVPAKDYQYVLRRCDLDIDSSQPRKRKSKNITGLDLMGKNTKPHPSIHNSSPWRGTHMDFPMPVGTDPSFHVRQ
jgi:hypothetical protein